MQSNLIAIDRPVRWDHPLSQEMLTRDIAWMLEQSPFADMNQEVFPSHCSLESVIRHDSRILRFEPGDIVVREGDYGSSAFIVLRGSVRAFLESLWNQQGKPELTSRASDWFSKFLGKLKANKPHQHVDRRGANRSSAESNRAGTSAKAPVQRVEQTEGGNRIFLQDINAVIEGYQSESLGVGELFGEMAAITRSQHRYTVVADSPAVVLEIRWQGLRMLRRDKGFREYLDARYRSSSLQTHLRETELFRFLDDESMQHVIDATKLESFGDMEWFAEYKDTQKLDVQKQIDREPLIATEGKPASDLILIRAGFARLSFEQGRGHQTIAYLGRGRMFGLPELSQRYREPNARPLPYQESLRALGFVDVLKIPADIVLKYVLPKVRKSELPTPLKSLRYDSGGLVVPSADTPVETSALETPLLEFLVDQRLINGHKTMMIDLDRCTQCDDCVRACANTHGGTPRFVRNGPQYGPLLFAHSCMHCEDPVCMIGCPTGAINRNQDTGVISINENTCIGCKTCSESCPYSNIVMIQARDESGRLAVDRNTQLPILQASKCDLCHHLPTGPSCQNACPHQALIRMDTSDPSKLNEWISRRAS